MLQSKAGYIDARPFTASSTKSTCDARPDHTSGSLAPFRASCGYFRSFPGSKHRSTLPPCLRKVPIPNIRMQNRAAGGGRSPSARPSSFRV
jgi:hypothetical protein